MAFWTGSIQDINEGLAANDGSGDSIRSAFFKVDTNFQQINNFLGNTTIDFLTANVVSKLNAGNANILTLQTNTITVNSASVTGNVTAANLIVTNNAYINGQTYFSSNINVAGAIIPAGNGLYDLGSPANPFRNLYYVSAVSGGTVTTSDAGMLIVHANALVGDIKDVGIQGNVSHSYNSNTYAFFGFQKTTQDFIYKIGPSNWAVGNSVAYDGVYGAAHFGSGNFSNTTISNSTTNGALVVSGGTGIGGNLNVGGNARVTGDVYITGNTYANGGYQVVTTSLIGNPNAPLYTGGVITGNAVFVSQAQSGNVYTGAITVPYGGVGVFGNINAGGFVGPYYGTIQTAAQPNITSLGTLPVLNASTVNYTNLNGTNITATGLVNFTGATMTGLTSITLSGNMSAASVVGAYYGTIQTASQPNITYVGNLTTANVVGNLSAGNVSANIYSNNYRYANGAPFVSTSLANTAEITANLSSGQGVGLSLVATGVSAGNYGSATSIPTIVVDAKGRVTSLTSNAVSTTISLTANTGTGSVSGGGTLTVAGNSGVSTSVVGSSVIITNTGVTSILAGNAISVNSSSGNVTITNGGVTNLIGGTDISVSAGTGVVTINDTSTLATVVGRGATTPIGTAVTINGALNVSTSIVPTGSNTVPLGSSTLWFSNVWAQNFFGVSNTAKYADLAEKYLPDQDYAVGTVVAVGGTAEVTACSQGDRAIGVVSANPAYKMNSDLENGTYIALKGRVPCRVVGVVNKGQQLVAADNGTARAADNNTLTFAIALESSQDPAEKIIEVLVL